MPKRTLVTGCNGQLGHAVRALRGGAWSGVASSTRTSTSSTSPIRTGIRQRYDWSLYGTIINAGAYTAVDKAETAEGRPVAWKANAQGPALLARVAKDHHITPACM
ncbi:MAG: sugar nucleotide-binding protein [Bifidobacterium pseudocatenulatum]